LAKRYIDIDSANIPNVIGEFNNLMSKVGDIWNLNAESDSDLVVASNASIADVDSNSVTITSAKALVDSADSDLRRLQNLIDSADSIASTLQDQIDSADVKVSTQQGLLDNAESDANYLKELFRGITGFTGQDSTIATGNFQISTGSQVGGGPFIITYTNLIPGIDSNGDLVTDLDRFYDAGIGANDILQLNDEGRIAPSLARRRPNAIFEEQKTGSGNIVGGSAFGPIWVPRDLSDVVYDPENDVQVSSFEASYPYSFFTRTTVVSRFRFTRDGWIRWSCPAYYVNQHQTRLWNETDSDLVVMGTSEGTDPNEDGVVTRSFGSGPVVANKWYEIQHITRQRKGSNGFGWGRDWGDGTPAIFSQAHYWRA